MEATHQPREQLEWLTPADEALRLYHAAVWSTGAWTVPAAKPVIEEDFEDFNLEALKVEEEEETPIPLILPIPPIDSTAKSNA